MKSVVLLSGGVDSTVLLASRRDLGDELMAVTFDYLQTHRREILSADAIADHYRIRHEVIPISGVFTGSALTGHFPVPVDHNDNTIVPGRNLVFIALAVAVAQSWHASTVFIGANADDAANYPDCRPDFISNIGQAVTAAYPVSVNAPLLSRSKADILRLAHQLNVPLELTWSCYRGGNTPCGMCGACRTRADADAEVAACT
jgi:7-cyano-7-deazaguanine synthase